MERNGATTPIPSTTGEKGKARDLIAAIRTLKAIEHEQRPATPDERQALSPLRRLRPRGPVDLSRPGHGPLQGRLADPRRGAAIPAHARGIRFRQADHLQRLLHLADRHRGHARRPGPPGRARERHRAGARLRDRQLHERRPAGREGCGSSASSSTASPAASPGRSTPKPTSASRISATPSCPRAGSTP